MPYDIETIKKLLQSESGRNLKYFLDEEMSNLRNINNLTISLNPIKTAIEIRATKKAFDILTKILGKICDWEEKERPPHPNMPIY